MRTCKFRARSKMLLFDSQWILIIIFNKIRTSHSMNRYCAPNGNKKPVEWFLYYNIRMFKSKESDCLSINIVRKDERVTSENQIVFKKSGSCELNSTCTHCKFHTFSGNSFNNFLSIFYWYLLYSWTIIVTTSAWATTVLYQKHICSAKIILISNSFADYYFYVNER